MKHTLEASKLFPYIAIGAILLFVFFAYRLLSGVGETASPLRDKMDVKVEAIKSIPKGNKKSVK